jgi:DNA helicase-2/ATP-dependent DNA helicase PcrA
MLFEERYKKLNTEQKKAVDTIDGPVLVVAGPGSGKTEILSIRVAQILKQTDTSPSSVLCLTFTDSASINMRERLVGLIGSEAYRVGVYTFHSFCTEIIGRYPEYFFGSADFHPADEVTRLELLEGLFKDMSHDNPLRSEHPEKGFVFLRSALSAFSDLKRAGISPEDFKKVIEHNKTVLDLLKPLFTAHIPERISKKEVSELETLREKIKNLSVPPVPCAHISSLHTELYRSLSVALEAYQTSGSSTPLSEWKRKEVEKTIQGFVPKDTERIEKNNALASLYELYQKTLFDAGYFDFDDMILQVVHALETNELLAQMLQERFQYILVDEFQDTNDAQMRLLYSLTSSLVHEGRPNIMAVGDDDQSIYRFQGAEVANMLAFTTQFREPVIISLHKNYRSTADILDISESVISQSTNSLRVLLPQIEKKIIASNTDLPKGHVHFKTCTTVLHEYMYIAEEITKLHDKGIPYKDIAIIARKHHTLQDMLPYLHRAGISVRYERRTNVFHNEIIIQLITILRFIHSLSNTTGVSQDDLLPRILSFPFWNIPRKTVWQISLSAQKDKVTWLEVMSSHEDIHIRNIADFLITLGVDSSSSPLERMLDRVIGGRVSEVVEDEYTDESVDQITEDNTDFVSPFRTYYFGTEKFEKNKTEYIAFLSALKVFVSALREYKSGRVLSVSDAIHFVDVYEKNGIELLDQSPYIESDSAVTLLTSHKAKGLEFPIVFVVSATDDMWSGKGIPDKLPFPKNIHAKASPDSVDDKMRLLYVALTRAQHTLYVTHYREHTNGKKALVSEFLTSHHDKFVGVDTEATNTTILEIHTLFSAPQTQDEKALLGSTLLNYQMSVTHLNNFLNVAHGGPALFLEQNLLRFPQAKTVSSVYGTALHKALQYVYVYYKHEGKLPDISLIVEKAKHAILSGRLEQVDARVQTERAEKVLTLYMEKYGAMIDPTDYIETDFKHQGVVIEGAKITGKIDKMHVTGKHIVVSDWKTGKAKESWEVSGVDEKIQLHGYARQLLFYNILVSRSTDFHDYIVEEGRLEFLEPVKGECVTLPLVFEKDQIGRLERLIEIVYKKILHLDFPDTTQYSKDLAGCLQFEDDLLSSKV